MKKLHSISHYNYLLSEACDECPHKGFCCISFSKCIIKEEIEKVENFMENLSINYDQFVELIEGFEYLDSQDMWNINIAPQWEEEDRVLKEIAEEMDYDYWLECSQNAMFYDEQPWY